MVGDGFHILEYEILKIEISHVDQSKVRVGWLSQGGFQNSPI